MGVVAIYSPKGGVGKTTLSFELAWRFGQAGYRTLLLDLDTEGGAGFLAKVDRQHLVSDPYLLRNPFQLRSCAAKTEHSNLFYLGFADEVRGISSYLARLGPKKRIEELISNLRGAFDRIVLDCPPVRDVISDQIMSATDLMITPLPVSPLSARALQCVRDDQKRRGSGTTLLLPVFSMFDSRRKAHKFALSGWMSEFPTIPWSSEIERVAFNQAPIESFARHSRGAQALNRLWRGTEAKLQELQTPRRSRHDVTISETCNGGRTRVRT